MSVFGFLKNAGSKLWDSVAGKEAQAANSLKDHLEKIGIGNPNLKIEVADEIVTVSGEIDTQEEKEKVLLALGNVQGVAEVKDNITVLNKATTATEARFVTVEKGDTLSAISKRVYGDANKYNKIFEANKPMLTHPDKIYPGQSLRIPD